MDRAARISGLVPAVLGKNTHTNNTLTALHFAQIRINPRLYRASARHAIRDTIAQATLAIAIAQRIREFRLSSVSSRHAYYFIQDV